MKSRKLGRGVTLPEMLPGQYRLLYPLRLRKGPGLNYECRPVKKVKKETAEKMKIDGTLPAGIMVKIDEIKYLSVSIWGRSEDGWLCLYMSHTPYAKSVRG